MCNIKIDVPTIKPSKITHEEAHMVCPECGHYPLTLIGKRVAHGFKNVKAQCAQCMYEEDIP